MKRYLIEGRKHFDKHGNTYHAVTITSLSPKSFGEAVFNSSAKAYGYGEHWKQTAYEELTRLRKVRKEDQHNHELNRKRFIYRVHDVNAARDLIWE